MSFPISFYHPRPLCQSFSEASESGLPAISLMPYFNDIPPDNLIQCFHKLSLTGIGRRGIQTGFPVKLPVCPRAKRLVTNSSAELQFGLGMTEYINTTETMFLQVGVWRLGRACCII